MHLIGLVESLDHVCCRYRLRTFRDDLATAGHDLEIRSLPRRWWDRLRLMSNLGGADAVILQRKLLPPWQTALLRRCARRLIFDFDDAVFMRDSYAARGPDSARRRGRFSAVVRTADAIVAGNDWLADQAFQARATGVVRVIPSCVETAIYPRAVHRPADGSVRLVWIGSSSTLNGLEQTRTLFDAVADAIPGVRLKLISNRFPNFGPLPVEPCPWSADTEAAEIAAADIGVSWVPDDDWSRGKCGLKVLQYMAAGLPVVANPVGVHATLIRHGETGFLAATADEWVDAIRRLAADAELRRRMEALGRWRAEGDFSVTAGADVGEICWLTRCSLIGQPDDPRESRMPMTVAGPAVRWHMSPTMRERLLGPDGLPLGDWLRAGIATIVKDAHSSVRLPRSASRIGLPYQVLPARRPAWPRARNAPTDQIKARIFNRRRPEGSRHSHA